MEEVKQALWATYKKISGQLDEMDPESENYKVVLEEQNKILKELADVERISMEKAHENERAKAEDKREWFKIGLKIGGFLITTGVGIWGVNKTFRFDTDSTVTSTLGRGILNTVTSNLFKTTRIS